MHVVDRRTEFAASHLNANIYIALKILLLLAYKNCTVTVIFVT